jgi:hypothetical protein
MSTLVSNLAERRRLGSFFFFKRGDAKLSDPTALWRTVAFDLAKFHPSIESSVIEFLNRPGFRQTDIFLHFKCLIEYILNQLAQELSAFPPVIVLDALDECGTESSQSAQRQILLDTLTRWTHLPHQFKLIVASRDERLPESFHDPNLCRKITLETGDSVDPETNNDIRIFFEQSLDVIRPTLGLPSTWPGRSTIAELTKRAAGLFIWATTAIAFLAEKRSNPNTKLKLILAGNLGRNVESIDILYKNILDFAFGDSDDAIIEMFETVVGAIVVAKEPISAEDLKQFHRVGEQNEEDDWVFNLVLHGLSSVIVLDGPLRIKHLSFAEFLTDPSRCHDRRFVIDTAQQHRRLALACLRVMNSELRFNICGLETSHIRNDDVVELPKRIAASVSTRLQYSCRFWTAHLCDTTNIGDFWRPLSQEVLDFFYSRLLYWLEVMSLIKEIPTSLVGLLVFARWMEKNVNSKSSFRYG